MKEMAETIDAAELGDPYAIDYRILPLAPAPSTRQPSLWELFLLGLRSSAPYFALRPEATVPRERPGA